MSPTLNKPDLRRSVEDQLEALAEVAAGGRLVEARAAVRRISTRRLTRAQRCQLARLANLAFAHRRALRLLHRVVRPKTTAVAPTDLEIAEYARALIGLDAFDEAIALLNGIIRRRPEFAPIYALSLFRRWNWVAALPVLERALRNESLPAFTRRLACNRLALALLHGARDPGRAERVVVRLMAEVPRTPENRRIDWENWQVRLQVHYLRGEWDEALACSDELLAIFSREQDELRGLFARKWRLLTELSRGRPKGALLRGLYEISDRLTELGNWEHARSCLYYTAVAARDEQLVTRLCYGTPYPGFEERLLGDLGWPASKLPATYDLALGPARKNAPVLDVVSGPLKPGSALQRLLAALTADLFIPPNVERLHALLFPNDAFNPGSSPVRMRQVIRRFRGWLAAQKIPLRLEESHERYRLVSDTGIVLRLTRQAAGKLELIANRARERFGTSEFGAAELMRLLGGSRSSAFYTLRELLDARHLERLGSGPRTRYRLLPG